MKPPLLFDEIQTLLPHRYPLLMVDRVLDWKEFESLHAIRNVTGNDPILAGHFPGMAILPGALIVEGMAQCGLLLMRLSGSRWTEGRLPVLGSIRAKFWKPVVPGDRMTFEVRLLKAISTGAMLRGSASVDGCAVADCDMTVAISEPGILSRSEQEQMQLA